MKVHEPNNRVTIRNLAIFVAVVLGIGWIGRGLDTLMGNPASEGLGMLVWLVVPTGISLLLRAFAGDGWADAGFRPRFEGNAVWYSIALLIYPVLTALVLLVGKGVGTITFPNLSLNTLGLIAQAFALGLVPQFTKNLFEETACEDTLPRKSICCAGTISWDT